MKSFWHGAAAGCIAVIVLVIVFIVIQFCGNMRREEIELLEKQTELQTLREEYRGRAAGEFLDGLPGARAAADEGKQRLEAKREELLQRGRDGNAD
jgi:flagellar biosynthesis/type III secretory pathway M-ring protein FliF/YscJ